MDHSAPIYLRVLMRLGWVQPDVIADHPGPHVFAQGFGGVVLLGATLALSSFWRYLCR